MIHILLVRHGQAGKPDPALWPDDDLRPLTGKGRKAFKHAARGLRSQAPDSSRILTSPALRTLQTAEVLADGLRLDKKAIRIVPELHHGIAPAKALETLAHMHPKRLPRSMVLVGHEPWLGEFLSLLIAGGAKYASTALDKGGACLVEAESLDRGKGVLRWLLTQEQLRDLA
ncbi:MAG: histidine phosphatase family protein [Fibrobacteria bacterium]